jgi:predicted transcriptional regulator
MTDKELFKILLFISENNNFKINEIEDLADEKIGWKLFLKYIDELENQNFLIDDYNSNTYSLTVLGKNKLFELTQYFEKLEKDEQLSRNKLINEVRLSNWQVRTFWWIFGFAVIGTFLSVYNFTNSLSTSKNEEQQELKIKQMELELSKLHTLILDQKKDTLLIESNFHKEK